MLHAYLFKSNYFGNRNVHARCSMYIYIVQCTCCSMYIVQCTCALFNVHCLGRNILYHSDLPVCSCRLLKVINGNSLP